MKTYTNRPPGFLKLASLAFIGFVASTVFVQGTALADTAANTVIRNTANVSWQDGALNNYNTSAQVDITINLVAASPALSIASATQTIFSGSTAEYTYTLTTNANGPDDYFFNPAPAQSASTGNIDSLSLAIFDGPGATGSSYGTTDAFSLAATTVATNVTIPANGSATVEVPNDGTAGGGLNGFTGGETILVNGWVLTLDSVDTDPATGIATVTISDSTGNARNLTTGMLIAQQRTFYLRVTPTATINGSTTTVTTTVTDGANTVTGDTVTTVNIAPNITVTKYVRNVFNASGNPGAGGFDINGADYFTTGVSGIAGDTLEYVIVVANATNAGTAVNVVIEDQIPAFTTYVNNSLLLDVDTDPNGGVASWPTTPSDTEDDGDEGEYRAANDTVYIYAGTGGDDTDAGAPPYGTGGSLAGGTYTFGAFRVTIDN